MGTVRLHEVQHEQICVDDAESVLEDFYVCANDEILKSQKSFLMKREICISQGKSSIFALNVFFASFTT